jgi:hypothetical protein
VQLAPLTKSNVKVAEVIDPRRIFKADSFDLPSGVGDGFYALGRLVWTVGENANAGWLSEVKKYTEADRRIELQLPTPLDIVTNLTQPDRFTLIPGDDKLFSTCRDKFDNADRFGGWRFLRGYKQLKG